MSVEDNKPKVVRDPIADKLVELLENPDVLEAVAKGGLENPVTRAFVEAIIITADADRREAEEVLG